MARFLLECPHTEEDCVHALDSVVALSHSMMERFDWGCNDNVHVGWLIIEAQDADMAKMMLPTIIRGKAHAVQLTKFSPDQVKSFHEGH